MVCYADFAQILATGTEVVIQFYESIPGPPNTPTGQIQSVRSRLRATVIVSPAHAVNIGRNLLTHAGTQPATAAAQKEGQR